MKAGQLARNHLSSQTGVHSRALIFGSARPALIPLQTNLERPARPWFRPMTAPENISTWLVKRSILAAMGNMMRRETQTMMRTRTRTRTTAPNQTTTLSPRSSENPMNSPREPGMPGNGAWHPPLPTSGRIAGDFGVGGRVVIEVSKDGTVYETANDRRRNPALATAPWLRTILDNAAFVRPRVYAGDDATLVTVTAVFRRPPR
jgi:hypothetical protein